jgi:hypothetical protein
MNKQQPEVRHVIEPDELVRIRAGIAILHTVRCRREELELLPYGGFWSVRKQFKLHALRDHKVNLASL